MHPGHVPINQCAPPEKPLQTFPNRYLSAAMGLAAVLFWLLLAGVFFAYVGYPVLLLALDLFRRQRTAPASSTWPSVTLVVAAYNEAAILPGKVRNALALDYPGELRLLLVTDGSTDNSGEGVAAFPGVQVLHQPERRGKTAALNRAVAFADTELLVFSDANTSLPPDALRKLLRHFNDPGVGAVAGEKRVQHSSGMGFAEGWYWHYESFLKKLDARFYSVVGAAGELFALRRPLFTVLPDDTVLDDLALSLEIGMQGKRIAYEPEAFALEAPSASLDDERRRKVRIAAGAFQLLDRLSWAKLLQQPALAFQFFVRRWLRWAFCPPALPLLLLLNLLLAIGHPAALYDLLLALQGTVYLLAGAGALLLRRNRAFFLCTVPFYFLFMNACLLEGWWRHRKGGQSVLWEKARRGREVKG
ncbi:MAG: glycosyltransferase family 2 protein [Chitinophagaceae bacterium]|nr:MAG: glycosyltransferase family 2 protein [Chitinophagaceae bacterium]